MEALGREFDVAASVGGASGAGSAAVGLKGGTGITFVCTGADTFTLTSAATSSGSYSSPGAIIDHYYQRAVLDGSAAWTRQTQTASNAVVQASNYTTVFTVQAAALPDTHAYVKCTVTGTNGKVTAIVHDLVHQRTPANLPALNA